MQEELKIYRLSPLAEPDDPNWQNASYQGEVVVAARSSGDARIVASEAELDFLEIDAKPAEGVTTTWPAHFAARSSTPWSRRGRPRTARNAACSAAR